MLAAIVLISDSIEIGANSDGTAWRAWHSLVRLN